MTQELHNRFPADEYLRSQDFDIPANQPGATSSLGAEDLPQPRLAELGEQRASSYFQAHGYRILERNWRAGRRGELDLIVCNPSGLLVFVEVKTRLVPRQEPGFDWPGFDAIHQRKQRQIISLARMYLAGHAAANTPCRFDVLIVWFSSTDGCHPAAREVQIFHVADAFSL